MPRGLALLLIPALLATTGVVSPVHIHAYLDHDHPEHHHGPATHAHQVHTPYKPDGATHIEGCDPSYHTISVAFLCSAPPQSHAIDLQSSFIHAPGLEPPAHTVVEITDVRVHGPPCSTKASPRGPPLTLHA